MARKDDVILLQEAALQILRRRGNFEQVGDESAKICKIGAIEIAFRTPKQKAMAIDAGSQYGLDIWDGRKVLSILWDHHGDTLQIVRFKRGDWESTLLSVASQAKGVSPLPLEWAEPLNP